MSPKDIGFILIHPLLSYEVRYVKWQHTHTKLSLNFASMKKILPASRVIWQIWERYSERKRGRDNVLEIEKKGSEIIQLPLTVINLSNNWTDQKCLIYLYLFHLIAPKCSRSHASLLVHYLPTEIKCIFISHFFIDCFYVLKMKRIWRRWSSDIDAPQPFVSSTVQETKVCTHRIEHTTTENQ